MVNIEGRGEEMLTCIACSKKLEDEGDNGLPGGIPSNKDAGKSLTAQIKDMAIKFSGAYRQCKPCIGPSSSIIGAGAGGYHRGLRPPPYGGFHWKARVQEQGSSSFTPPIWDHQPLETMSPSPRVVYRAGERTPPEPELDTISSRSGDVAIVEEDEAKDWMAEVEPGVHITFVSLPHGGNDLKRIRFSREMFNKWEAQRWWGENYDRIMELYNVQRFNRQALPTPPRSEDERDGHSRMGSARESPATPSISRERMQMNRYRPPMDCGLQMQSSMAGMPTMVAKLATSSVDASRTTTSSRDENSVSISNASDQEAEWVEQDEPGVYITLRALADGTRELRRVRFSRERFGEVHAKLWWEQNRERIQEQYL